jgi:hypothetical protein
LIPLAESFAAALKDFLILHFQAVNVYLGERRTPERFRMTLVGPHVFALLNDRVVGVSMSEIDISGDQIDHYRELMQRALAGRGAVRESTPEQTQDFRSHRACPTM